MDGRLHQDIGAGSPDGRPRRSETPVLDGGTSYTNAGRTSTLQPSRQVSVAVPHSAESTGEYTTSGREPPKLLLVVPRQLINKVLTWHHDSPRPDILVTRRHWRN